MVGDRIVEVNGVNVSLENHKQVVARIQAGQDKTSLLVVDKACDDYHILHEIVVRSSLGHVVKLSDKGEYEDVEKVAMDINMNLVDNNNKTDKVNGFQESTEMPKINTVSPVDKNGIKLDLSMTAKEMRDMIVSRKKKDPRKEKRRDMRG